MPLEFGNIEHILRARRGRQFALAAERGRLLALRASLRTEFDPETKTLIVPGEQKRTCREIQSCIESLDIDIGEVSLIIAALESEKLFVARSRLGD